MTGGKQKCECCRDKESNAEMSCVKKKWAFLNKKQPHWWKKYLDQNYTQKTSIQQWQRAPPIWGEKEPLSTVGQEGTENHQEEKQTQETTKKERPTLSNDRTICGNYHSHHRWGPLSLRVSRTRTWPLSLRVSRTSPALFNHPRLMSGGETAADGGRGQSPGGDTPTKIHRRRSRLVLGTSWVWQRRRRRAEENRCKLFVISAYMERRVELKLK